MCPVRICGLPRPKSGTWGTQLHPKLTQMMIKVLVRQNGPLVGSHAPKEAVGMGGAARRTRGCEAVNQCEQPLAFYFEVAVVVYEEVF
jgi:hypothetical protein